MAEALVAMCTVFNVNKYGDTLLDTNECHYRLALVSHLQSAAAVLSSSAPIGPSLDNKKSQVQVGDSHLVNISF